MSVASKVPRIGVAAVVERDGKVLLGRRKGAHGAGDWATPGGHLEFGEQVKACAIRELMEETGLKADEESTRLGPWVENMMENGEKHYITLFVFVDAPDGEPSLLEPEKCHGWEWFPWRALPAPLFPSTQSFINQRSE